MKNSKKVNGKISKSAFIRQHPDLEAIALHELAKKSNIDLKLAYIYTVRSAIKAKAKAKKAVAGPKVKRAVARRKAMPKTAMVVHQKAALLPPRKQPTSSTLEKVLLQSIFNAGLNQARQLLTKIESDAARYMV